MKKITRRSFLQAATAATAAAAFAACSESASSTSTAASSSVAASTSTADSVAADGAVSCPAGYPDKAIEFIVPVPAGGMVDLEARAVESSVELGGDTYVTNLEGGAGIIGLLESLTRTPDGTSIVIGTVPQFCISPLLNKADYSVEDFRFIALTGDPTGNAIFVSADSEFETFDDLVAAIEAGQPINYASPGATSIARFAAVEAFNQLSLTCEHVSYNSNNEAITALIGGYVDVFCGEVGSTQNYVNEGQLKCLAILSDKELDSYPGVPCAADYGVEGMDAFVSTALVAVLKDTPEDVVAWLKQQVNIGLASEAFSSLRAGWGLSTYDSVEDTYSEDAINELIYAARDKFTAILQELGMI